jgi:hypothetical protein
MAYVYVLDPQGRLVGVLSLRELVLADPAQDVDDIMEDDLVTVATGTDEEEVAKIMTKYNLLAVPVLDEERRMLGIVTLDDALEHPPRRLEAPLPPLPLGPAAASDGSAGRAQGGGLRRPGRPRPTLRGAGCAGAPRSPSRGRGDGARPHRRPGPEPAPSGTSGWKRLRPHVAAEGDRRARAPRANASRDSHGGA